MWRDFCGGSQCLVGTYEFQCLYLYTNLLFNLVYRTKGNNYQKFMKNTQAEILRNFFHLALLPLKAEKRPDFYA